ncbi:hypothetical protein M409DRAFT_17279 [Zasmidium cellare ATCC 36951]|uniref:SnoaL-like domain-containing protein n=1 Tax=Zasmidium cellare ATCC 36951 TaxID=1080233 RepID=A0A6A6D5C9_ZASCE|nr:uncharacterized protein M409DRAFT_17279 [Zasmidium cellare ATCC 36951]KAF2173339.1 hypothetical protein M409DRAFT_17279 [Zasmidium cellare ATCC 36951]
MATIPYVASFQQSSWESTLRLRHLTCKISMADQVIKKESSEPSPQQQTARHLEDIASSFIEAINSRNFDPNTKPWNQIAAHFTVGSGTGARPNATNKLDMLEGHRKLAEANPMFKIRITSFSTTVHENIGTAQVVMNAGSTGVPGVPVGMWRNAVTILDFRLLDGRWLGVRECTMSGLGRMDEEWF